MHPCVESQVDLRGLGKSAMAVSPLCETKVDLRNREEVQRPKMSPMGKQVDSWEGGGRCSYNGCVTPVLSPNFFLLFHHAQKDVDIKCQKQGCVCVCVCVHLKAIFIAV